MSDVRQALAARLNQAVESNPLAPPIVHGRQKWLRDKLAHETNVDVSANTVNKWLRGIAKPRPEAMRALARTLQVDEVWLEHGKTPSASPSAARALEAKASAVVMLAAGLIEANGGRVTFPEDGGPTLTVNLGGTSFRAIVVTPQITGKEYSFLVPEPSDGCRVFGVMLEHEVSCGVSACVNLVELTGVERQKFGGYSIAVLERRKDGRFKVDGKRGLLSHVPAITSLVAA